MVLNLIKNACTDSALHAHDANVMFTLHFNNSNNIFSRFSSFIYLYIERIFLLDNLIRLWHRWIRPNMFFYIFKSVKQKKSMIAVYVIILSIVLGTSHISPSRLAYAQSSVSITCGPTQQSNLSVSMSVDEFVPKSFIHYKFYVRIIQWSMVDSQQGLMVKTR